MLTSVAVLLAMCRHGEVAYDFRTSLIQIRTNTSTKSISDPKHSIVFATPQKKPFELHNNFGLMHLNAFTIGSHINQNVQRGKQCVDKMQFYARENLWLIQRPMDASWSNLCEIRSHFTRRELCCIILLIAWMVLEILNLNVWSLKMDQQYKSYADYVYVTKVLAFAMLLSLGNWKLNRIVCLCARNSSIFFFINYKE